MASERKHYAVQLKRVSFAIIGLEADSPEQAMELVQALLDSNLPIADLIDRQGQGKTFGGWSPGEPYIVQAKGRGEDWVLYRTEDGTEVILQDGE